MFTMNRYGRTNSLSYSQSKPQPHSATGRQHRPAMADWPWLVTSLRSPRNRKAAMPIPDQGDRTGEHSTVCRASSSWRQDTQGGQHAFQRRMNQCADPGGQHQQHAQRQPVAPCRSGMGIGLFLAMEGDEDQAEGIEGGQERADQTGPEQASCRWPQASQRISSLL
jgi:hypothetical protein